jgi:hypothetical protein
MAQNAQTIGARKHPNQAIRKWTFTVRFRSPEGVDEALKNEAKRFKEKRLSRKYLPRFYWHAN